MREVSSEDSEIYKGDIAESEHTQATGQERYKPFLMDEFVVSARAKKNGASIIKRAVDLAQNAKDV